MEKSKLIRIVVTSTLLLITTLISRFVDLNIYVKLTLHIIPYLIIGYDILIETVKKLMKGKALDEHFLMTVATIGAFFLGKYQEAVAIFLFFQIGELFEDYASDKSEKSIEKLLSLKQDFANLETQDGIVSTPTENIKTDDIIIIGTGEKIPLDGIIVYGSAFADNSSLTGESVPVSLNAGDEAISGGIISSGFIKVRVTREYKDCTVSKIIELTEKAAQKTSKSEKFITRFSKIYTPVVVILSILIATIPSIITKTPAVYIERALIFLVISCPCALVVSIPLCFFMGIGNASRHGILIKGGEYMEKLSSCKTFIFDKTGTITYGIFKIKEIHSENISPEKLLEFAAYSESISSHPIAESVLKEYGKPINQDRIKDIKEFSGKGIYALIDDTEVFIGNALLMDENEISYQKQDDFSLIYIALNHNYEGYIKFSDTIKENASDTINNLKKSGIKKTVMLTGDNFKNSEEICKNAGIDEFYSSLLPDDKLKITEKIMKESNKPVAYAGDGINDAPVLSYADVGISMGSVGSDIAIDASDIVITDDNLSRIVKALKISKKTVYKSYFLIIFILALKFGILLLSATGILGMWAAVFADVGTLIISVLIALFDI